MSKTYTPDDWRGKGFAFVSWAGESRSKRYSRYTVRRNIDCAREMNVQEVEAHHRLVTSAWDHAAFCRALLAGWIRWEPFFPGGESKTGELCIDGLRHCTTLDEFGVPQLTPTVRVAIANAEANS